MNYLLFAVLAFSTLWISAGCSVLPAHFHSDGNAAVATRMQSTMQSYSATEPSMYQAMLNNVQRFTVQEDAVIAELSNNRQAALLHQFSSLTRSDVDKQIKRINQDIEDSDKFLKSTTSDYLKEQKVLTSAAGETKAAIGKLQESLDEAKNDLSQWNATVAALQKAAEELPVVVDKQEASKTGSEALTAALGSIGAESVDFVDAGGVKQRKRIQDILKDQIFNGKSKSVSLDIPSPPGIEITIINLALNLAEIQQERTTARLHELGRRFELFGETYASLRLAKELMGEVDAAHIVSGNLQLHSAVSLAASDARIQLDRLNSRDPAVDAVARGDAAKNVTQALSGLELGLKDLRYMAVADTIAERATVGVKMSMARFDHEKSIVESRLNDRAWRELLKAGIDGLKAYHDGGFSAEDAATITRVLNTAALAVIASK